MRRHWYRIQEVYRGKHYCYIPSRDGSCTSLSDGIERDVFEGFGMTHRTWTARHRHFRSPGDGWTFTYVELQEPLHYELWICYDEEPYLYDVTGIWNAGQLWIKQKLLFSLVTTVECFFLCHVCVSRFQDWCFVLFYIQLNESKGSRCETLLICADVYWRSGAALSSADRPGVPRQNKTNSFNNSHITLLYRQIHRHI